MRLRTAPSIVAGTSRLSRSPTTAGPSVAPRRRPPSRMVCTSCSQKNGMAGDAVVDEAGQLARQIA